MQLDPFIKNIEKALARGDKITLVGFGTFEIKRRNARDGRNPKTGETIYIPSTKVINFKAGKKLKQIINKI
jgi:DNA-binding protein HU-beta